MGIHKHINIHDRRNFLKNMVGAGCASLTLSPFLSTITNLNLLNAAASANQKIYAPSNYKALVCVMLSGGNDSYNMLVPSGDSADFGSEYDEYKEARSTIALPQSDLIDLNPITIDPMGRQFGLHKNLPRIQSLFNGTPENNFEDRHLSFIANVGTLTEQGLTVNSYNDGSKSKPYQLFSHSDQSESWQTGIADGFGTTGWGGRIADILMENNTNQDISMNIALDGVNVFQRGNKVTEYVIQAATTGGSVKLYDSDTSKFYDSVKMATTDSILDVGYQNILEKAYSNEIKKAKANSSDFYLAISESNLTTIFPETSLGRQLKMVAKTIANRNNLGGGFTNQTFFVNLKGFDSHDNLLAEQSSLFKQLDEALYSFYQALIEIDLLNQVTTFTMSDFARTLRSNGDGTDHAWGGHHFVMGGDVNGGQIFGEYPRLNEDSTYNIGQGRMIPTTSCDEYFADLALWFGASTADLDTILPNLNRFEYNVNDGLGLFG